jgi:hypothetical protein
MRCAPDDWHAPRDVAWLTATMRSIPSSRILACGCRYATTAFMLRAMRGLVLRHYIVRLPHGRRGRYVTVTLLVGGVGRTQSPVCQHIP